MAFGPTNSRARQIEILQMQEKIRRARLLYAFRRRRLGGGRVPSVYNRRTLRIEAGRVTKPDRYT